MSEQEMVIVPRQLLDKLRCECYHNAWELVPEIDACHVLPEAACSTEFEGLRKDADRYRWLRTGGCETLDQSDDPQERMKDSQWLAAGYSVHESNGYDTYMNVLDGDELDKAVDEAMTKEKS